LRRYDTGPEAGGTGGFKSYHEEQKQYRGEIKELKVENEKVKKENREIKAEMHRINEKVVMDKKKKT
jgi:predicted RNase H-like nuclease (RuvC/YqgF family)